MSLNAEVTKTGNESTLAVIRKFSRRVQGTGLVKNSRKRRYYERPMSKTVQKKRALKLIKRRKEFQQLLKDGKVAEPAPRRGYQRAPETQAKAEQQQNQNSQSRFGETTPIAR